MDSAALREELRPHGIVSEACRRCVFFDICGGIEPDRALLDCFDLCGGDCAVCDEVCPRKPDFFRRLREVRGLRYTQDVVIRQAIDNLPLYIPTIHHGYCRATDLSIPVVALETYDLLRLVDRSYRCIAGSPREVRARFRLQKDTRILLRGTAKDGFLERFWSYRRRDAAPAQLASLGITAVIGPNFSHFLGVPRTDNLYNRKRQLICLEEFQLAGLSPIPHLNAVTPGDWQFWRDYLRQNQDVMYVSVEFQTGNQNATQGTAVIDRLCWLQDELGRTVHPVLIGAARFTAYIAATFAHFSILDSRPFMNAIKRRIFQPGWRGPLKPRWIRRRTKQDEPIDELLIGNIHEYSLWLGKWRRIASTSE